MSYWTPTQLDDEYLKWWKTEDPVWLKDRKIKWREIGRACYADLSASDILIYRTYYLTGERKGLIDDYSKLLLAPLLSRDMVLDFFLNSRIVPVTQKQILGDYFNRTNGANILDWYEDHAKYVAKALYGETHEPFLVQEGRNIRDIAPNPDWFYERFFSRVNKVLNNPKLYTGYVECVEYTISLIPKMTGHYKPHDKTPDELIRSAFSALSNNELPQRITILAEKLLSKENEIMSAWAENSSLNNTTGT